MLLATAPPEVHGAAPDIFPAIPEVRSQHGVARLTLDVVLDPTDGKPVFEYEGVAGVAPTIRVNAGDTIALTLRNAMPRVEGQANDINLHFHGLIVSPRAPGDDVLDSLAHPGQTLRYVVKIPPDHEPGLYWYHPHAHGATYADVTNGMSGAVVVEGMQQHFPALQQMRERIIVLRDVPSGANVVDEDLPMPRMSGASQAQSPAGPRRATNAGRPCRAEPALQPTLNRELHAHIGIASGERQFFRVVNASASRYFDLSVDGSRLALVARDGVPLDAYPGTRSPQIVRHVIMPPASRAEFIVTGPPGGGELRSACFDSGRTGDADPAADLATLVDSGTPVPSAQTTLGALRAGRGLPHNVLSQPLPAPAVKRTIRFTEDANGFYLNGRAFAMGDRPSIVARSGTVEEWTLLNETDEVHDFHIHQVHFVATRLDGAVVNPRVWSDTLSVAPRRRGVDGRYTPGSATVIVDFRDPIVRGTFVFHCHILDHEDQGMMAVIEVV